jgi:hypothetical protein
MVDTSECLRLRPQYATAVTVITLKRDFTNRPYLQIADCCRRLFPPFASVGRNHLHSDFRYGVCRCPPALPPQEPFGNPRPQAFLFFGFASSP